MAETVRDPDLELRIAAGKEGKLWVVEVICKCGGETMRQGRENMYGEEVMKMREGLFRVGFQVWRDPGHWIIVPPYDILEVHVWKQKSYVHNAFTGQ